MATTTCAEWRGGMSPRVIRFRAGVVGGERRGAAEDGG